MRIIFFALFLTSCVTQAPLGIATLDPSQKNECVVACKKVGMKLGAFVIISGRTGCVCEPKQSKSAKASAAAVGGALAEIIDQENQQRRNASQQYATPYGQ